MPPPAPHAVPVEVITVVRKVAQPSASPVKETEPMKVGVFCRTASPVPVVAGPAIVVAPVHWAISRFVGAPTFDTSPPLPGVHHVPLPHQTVVPVPPGGC